LYAYCILTTPSFLLLTCPPVCRSSFLPPSSFFPPSFFNAPPPPDIPTLSLHDALPICRTPRPRSCRSRWPEAVAGRRTASGHRRSEEHTSELQSRRDLVCRLLLEKKKKNKETEK